MEQIEDEKDEYSFLELINFNYLWQRYTGLFALKIRRVNGELVCNNSKITTIMNTALFVDAIGGVISIILAINAGNVNDINKTLAVWSNILVALVRGYPLHFKQQAILEVLNELDRLYPRQIWLRECLNFVKDYKSITNRFLFYNVISTAGLFLFSAMPLTMFLLYQKKDEPTNVDYHVLGTWRPYKSHYNAYYLNFLYESIIALCSISYYFTWDKIFVISLRQICMHYKFLGDTLSCMEAQESINPKKSTNFFKRLIECACFQLHLNKLANKFNQIFNMSLLVSDFVCAGSICLGMYMMLNTEDIYSIFVFVTPVTFAAVLAYDISKLGTNLATMSGNIQDALYNQSWYDGSFKYRRMILLWLQISSRAIKLTAFEMFEIDMVHFKEIMVFAYQLLTFLQSRND